MMMRTWTHPGDHPSPGNESATPPTGTKSPEGWASGNERVEPRDERQRTHSLDHRP